VTILPVPLPVEFSNTPADVCANQSVWLRVRKRTGEQYNWAGPDGFSAVADSVLAGNGLFGQFTVRAVRGICSGTASEINLASRPLPELSLNYIQAVCKGRTTAVSAQPSAGTTILWPNFTSENSSLFGVGKHWVLATLNGCTVSDTFLIGNSGPRADFSSNPSDSLLEVYREVSFSDASVPGQSPLASWSWDLGFAQQSDNRNPKVTYRFESETEIRLIVTDEAGCSDTVSKTIVIGPPLGWFIPNLFTPNGDGDNDLFVIGNLEKYPGTSLRIINRWGKLEAEIADYRNNWSGSGLEDGIYFYTIRRTDGQEFSGYIELKR